MRIWAVTYVQDNEATTENVAAVDFETLCGMLLGKSHDQRALNDREITRIEKCGEITITSKSFGKSKNV